MIKRTFFMIIAFAMILGISHNIFAGQEFTDGYVAHGFRIVNRIPVKAFDTDHAVSTDCYFEFNRSMPFDVVKPTFIPFESGRFSYYGCPNAYESNIIIFSHDPQDRVIVSLTQYYAGNDAYIEMNVPNSHSMQTVMIDDIEAFAVFCERDNHNDCECIQLYWLNGGSVFILWAYGFEYDLDMLVEIAKSTNIAPALRIYLENQGITNERLSELLSTGAIPKHVDELWLSGNKISDLSLLSELTNLQVLMIENNAIADLTPLKGLSNLKFLNLSNNYIHDITPLSHLRNLWYLDLNYNEIENLEPLHNLENLTRLQLFGNPFTFAQQLAIQNALPTCWIEADSFFFDCLVCYASPCICIEPTPQPTAPPPPTPPTPPRENIATIVFDPNGGAFVNPENDAIRKINHGELINTLPRATPLIFSRTGYRFTGWFKNPNDENTRWNDNNIVTADTTLYARWTQIPDPHTFRVGNINGGERITSADATTLAKYLAGHNDDICLLAADLNGDGLVTAADLILLARWLVGHDIKHLIAN